MRSMLSINLKDAGGTPAPLGERAAGGRWDSDAEALAVSLLKELRAKPQLTSRF